MVVLYTEKVLNLVAQWIFRTFFVFQLIQRQRMVSCRFSELSAVLEPGRPVKSDKLAILSDAIRVVNQLKTESEEYKEMNEKLLEEIKTLKVRQYKEFLNLFSFLISWYFSYWLTTFVLQLEKVEKHT